MKIKVCGLKDPGNISEVVKLAPDYMGFILYHRSPRFVTEFDFIDVPNNAVETGVFVNESVDKILELINKHNFGAVQLHGSEDPQSCKLLRKHVKVIKAFGVGEDFDFSQLIPYVGSVDFFLFDRKTDKHGGSGQAFDWKLLEKYELNIPFFLSGGLSLDNLQAVKAIKHPQFYGVDLNSRFEIEPGLKDINKLKKAFDILR